MTLLLLACSSPSTDLAVSEKGFGSPPPIPRTMGTVRRPGCGDLEEGYFLNVRTADDMAELRDYDVARDELDIRGIPGVTDLVCLARTEQLTINDAEDLVRVELSDLAVEALQLDDNPAVTEIVLDDIRNWSDGGTGFSDGVQIGDHPALTRLAVTNSTLPLLNINTDVADLSEIQATVETMLISSHTLADLSSLSASVESLAVEGDLLQTLELADIEGMAVRVGDVPALTALGSQRPVTMEHLYIWDAPLLEDLSLLQDLETAVGLSFDDLPAEDLHLDALVEVETLHLIDLEGIDDISFPSLEEAGTISLDHGSDEADIDLVGIDIDTLAVYLDGGLRRRRAARDPGDRRWQFGRGRAGRAERRAHRLLRWGR
ncbi:MAG: hypothetical protein GY913_22435 [Proteobacteria bacterium]|nr:hypothetical protein [Pseudomonadota bacterium]